MRYFLDTEFVDTGSHIFLISIGIVSDDGREYYAQNKDMQWSNDILNNPWVTPWIKENVVPHLTPDAWQEATDIRRQVEAFINAGNDEHELIGWCAAYDFVVLCQIFGTMMDLPRGWPHYIKDIQFILDERCISDDELPQQEGTVHNALADAKHIKRLWEHLHAPVPHVMPGQYVKPSMEEQIRMSNEQNRRWMGL